MVVGKIRGSMSEPYGASQPEVLDWRERSRTFAGLEFTQRVNMLVDPAGAPEWLVGAQASRGLLDLLGVRPILGRTFGPEEDQPGRHFVALISERFWRSRFAADTDVIGRRVRLSPNGVDATDLYEIIGVLPRDVPIDYRTPFDIVVPFVFSDIPRNSGARRTASLQVIGRLAAGASQEQASEEMRAVAAVLNREYPIGIPDASVAVRPLHEYIFGGSRRISFILLSAVALILAIAIVNLTNLLLTRAVQRRHEMAVRLAIGASRRQLLRQLAAEGLLLATMGGAGGILISVAVGRIFSNSAPPNLLRSDQIALDPVVLAFGLVTTMLTAFVASLLPAVHVSRTGASESLKLRDTHGSRLGRAISISAQTALVTIVLAAAGLLLGSVWKLARIPLGFNPTGIVTAQFIVPQKWLDDGPTRTTFEHELRSRVEAVPGAGGVSISSDVPMSTGSSVGVVPEGAAGPQFATVTSVDSSFLALLKIPLVAGRGFLDTDRSDAPLVALVNRAFVRKHWPDGTALGRRLTIRDIHTVVGVVEDVIELTDGSSRMRRGLVPSAAPAVYVPLDQFRTGRIGYINVRASRGFTLEALRTAMHDVSPQVTIRETSTIEDLARRATVETRFYASVLVLFGCSGILLAVIGVYGVVSQSVAERMREFGVRVALGASGGKLLRMVILQTATVLLLGAFIGIAAANLLTPMLKSWLFGVSANEPLILGAVVFAFICAGLGAALRPAIVAARADPMVALRAE
jgi:predicted permease